MQTTLSYLTRTNAIIEGLCREARRPQGRQVLHDLATSPEKFDKADAEAREIYQDLSGVLRPCSASAPAMVRALTAYNTTITSLLEKASTAAAQRMAATMVPPAAAPALQAGFPAGYEGWQ